MFAGIKEKLELKAMIDSIQPHMDALDIFMQEQVNAFEPEIQDFAKYCLEASGKRLRPILVFVSGGAFGKSINYDLIKVATIIEFVHIATLVHDDILDGAILRRHNPTMNKKYGAKLSVLMGDAVCSHALQLATEFPTMNVCRSVAIGMRRVCTGEITQTLWQGNTEYTEKDYFRVIDLKTAELFAVSAYLGAKVGSYSEDYAKAVEQFSRSLGVAFQIFDDLKDYMETEESAGKTLGTDLATGKYTLPIFELMRALPENEKEVFMEALRKQQLSFQKCVEMMKANNTFQKVRERCEAEVQKGEDALKPFMHEKPTSALLKMVGYMKIQVAKYF